MRFSRAHTSQLARSLTPPHCIDDNPTPTPHAIVRLCSKKNQAPNQKTKRYRRDIDQIHDDLKDKGKQKFLEDLAKKDIEDIPGAPGMRIYSHGLLS